LGAGASLLLAKMISTASLYYDSIRLGLYTRSTYLRYILVVTLVIATLFIHYWRA
jgi:hypothetical protein